MAQPLPAPASDRETCREDSEVSELDELRRLSQAATGGTWFVDQNTGFLVGGLPPEKHPDHELTDEEEADFDDESNPYEDAPLCSLLCDGGSAGDNDADFVAAAVNFVRALLRSDQPAIPPGFKLVPVKAENPAEALYRWLGKEYREQDPTTGEAFATEARPLVAALAAFIEAEGRPSPPAPAQSEEG